MPTVTAIALESLLEPGSSSHQPRSHGSSDPAPAPKEHQSRRLGGNGASPQEHYHHHHVHVHPRGGRREQQPVFLSRRPREASQAAGPPAGGGERAAGSRARSSVNGYYISPKLYATPEPTQIVPTGGVSSSSPNSVSSPSPYVVNHKRRDVPRRPPPPPPATTVAAASNGNGAPSSSVALKNNLDGFDSAAKPLDLGTGDTAEGLSNGNPKGCLDGRVEEVVARGGGGEGIEKVGEQEESSMGSKPNNSGLAALAENQRLDAGIDDGEDDDFFDPRELMSAMSSSDTEDTGSFPRGGSGRFQTPLTCQSEFFDATEDFLSDGSFSRSSPSSRSNIEADLRSIRLNLFEEIDRRKNAEEALDHMQNMFGRIARQLSQLESLPILAGENIHYDVDSAAQFCQEVVVMRFVSEALESCLAQVETEAAAETIIDAKNHEISRLRDRLQYYEAMNQEMSQRNQQAIEFARRRRQTQRARRKWIWGIGLSVAVGASLLSYAYLMHGGGGGENPSLPSSEQHDLPSETTTISAPPGMELCGYSSEVQQWDSQLKSGDQEGWEWWWWRQLWMFLGVHLAFVFELFPISVEL
ncbi:hypothetical protein Taro_038510 [Colocasia esculenta]|uniref:Uncharacterized protein n=1 Tax=Colocasia esculenta TaxID=4460 RepID=A0A843WSW7_COLES|nr:hypothetical protein [Colocasia esculenta]